MEDEQQLLFTNQSGIKALQLDCEEFARLLAESQATPLDADCSFSWCLANAAGLGTVEALDEFTGAAEEKARLEEEERQRQQEEEQRRQRERLEAERREQERQEQERIEQERLEQERIERERLEQERVEQERLEQERIERDRLEQERVEQERLAQERMERERLEVAQRERDRINPAFASAERKEQERLAQEELEARRKQEKIDEYLRQKQQRKQRREQEVPAESTGPAAGSAEHTALNLPMGAWLGFHDGKTPLLAKLAVHDREQDQYFFVNREGIKMRQLSTGELMDLVERGLVDILETNSSFRDEVTRIKNDLEE
jgi:hypothetical protein